MAIIESQEFDPEYSVMRRIYIDTESGNQVPEYEVLAMREQADYARRMAEQHAAAGREQAARELAAAAAMYQEQQRVLQEQQAAQAREQERLRLEGVAAWEAEQRARAYAEEQARAEAARVATLEASQRAAEEAERARVYEQQRQAEIQRIASERAAQEEAARVAESNRIAEQQRVAAAQAEAARAAETRNSAQRENMANSNYRVEQVYTGWGDAAGVDYVLVDPQGNRITSVVPTSDDYGNITGYYVDNSTNGGEGGGSSSFTPIDLDAINARAKQGEKPFGQGMGPALGYEYAMKNSYGDDFRKFDAQGNLTEFLDKDGNWQPASSFKPTGLIFNPMTGNLETAYKSPNSPRANITESTAYSINPYKEDQGGFLGEGGWQNLAKLALTGITAGLAAPATAAINAATGLGSIGSAALYGGLTGAAGGAITGGGQGALQGGLLGAAGGAAMGALGGGGAEAFPVEAPNANFTGLDAGNFNTWGMGEFQPFAGGDVGLGSGMVTQFNPDGSFVTLAGAPDYTYSVDTGADQGSVTTEQVDPNERVLTAEEAENLMRYNILPADMQTPAGFDLFETPKALLSGEYGGLIKGGLTLGALAAANALRSNEPVPTGGSGLTAAQLQAIVSTMPSMIGQYTAQAQDMGGTGQMGQGYTPAVSQAIAQLFPTFSLPTTGPFYGAGRFGEGYAPNAPIIKV